MTGKLTTAEVRLAATTNEDLPLTQYKKLEAGFDAWLAEREAAAGAKAVADFKKLILEAQKTATKPARDSENSNSTQAQTPSDESPAKPVKRKRIRSRNKKRPVTDNSHTES